MRHLITAGALLLLAGCTLQSNINKWDFGTVFVGETHTSGNITWKNTGSDQVNFLGAMGDWGAGSPFSLQPVPFQGSTLNKNAVSNPVQVVFAPTASGTFTGKLDPIRNVAPNQTCTANTVDIQGIAVAQVATGDLGIGGPAVTPGNALDFGATRANAGPPISVRVDVTNLGNAPIQVQASFKTGGQGFTILNPGANFAVPANGGKVTVKIQFLPTRVGKCWDVIQFIDTTNSANLSATSLTGEGTE